MIEWIDSHRADVLVTKCGEQIPCLTLDRPGYSCKTFVNSRKYSTDEWMSRLP